MSLTIRPATEADVPLLLEFIRGIAEYEKLLHEVVATEESLHESFFGERPVAEGIFGEWNGESAAFAVYFENFSTFEGRACLYLEDLFVKPEFRKKGIGQQMLTHLASIAVKRGCPRFDWVALDWNETAIDFYENLGAKNMAEWRHFRLSGEALIKVSNLY